MARARGHGSRRKTQWAGLGDAAGAASIPAPQALTVGTPAIVSFNAIVGGAAGLLDEEVTITRTVGMITCAMNVDTAVAEAGVAVGCAVARSEAITAGVASLPSPEDDPDFEWLFYASFALVNPQNALRDGPASAIHIPFDVKGQRIMRAGQSVVWIAETNESGVVLSANGRYLVKLT